MDLLAKLDRLIVGAALIVASIGSIAVGPLLLLVTGHGLDPQRDGRAVAACLLIMLVSAAFAYLGWRRWRRAALLWATFCVALSLSVSGLPLLALWASLLLQT
jgi:hypothetical protein